MGFSIDRDIALHILKTLRDMERVLTARDTVEAIHRGQGMVEYAPLTLDTVRARRSLNELVDVTRAETLPEPTGGAAVSKPHKHVQLCIYCGGDRTHPDHAQWCDGRQGRIEAAKPDPKPSATYNPIGHPRHTIRIPRTRRRTRSPAPRPASATRSTG